MANKHLISTNQFKDIGLLEEIFRRSDDWERWNREKLLPKPLKDKVIACLFFEPSTRTRLSFETAALKLGASVIGSENAAEFGSTSKGETLEDTIRILNSYADGIVMRHFQKGSAKAAAKVSRVPVINAGDGAGEHPTQALLDLYTIRQKFGFLDGIKIALVGDLLYGRTIHSLLNLIALYPSIRVYLVSPKSLALPDAAKQKWRSKGVKFSEQDDWCDILKKIDVLYMTRVQKERFSRAEDYERVKDVYRVDRKVLRELNKNAIIMHPLPRITEIPSEVDKDGRAAYFRQAQNGLYVRMALLEMLVG